jgi:hypothetical protein
MKKTLKLIAHYHKILREQAEEMPENPENPEEFDTSGGESPEDVLDNPEEMPQEEMPMTSEGENQYISDLIDAALYEPTSEDARLLTNLQSVMKMKKFTNAREEILPTILNVIRPATEENDIRDDLNQID